MHPRRCFSILPFFDGEFAYLPIAMPLQLKG